MNEMNTKSLKQELNTIQAAHQYIAKYVDDTIENIEQIKSWPESSSALNEQILRLIKEHHEAQVEEQALQSRIKSLGNDKNVEDAFACIVENLHHLGCSLKPILDEDSQTLYMFDFGDTQSLTVQCKGGYIRLIDMSPRRQNFAQIKLFLEQSQDLMGLISSLGMG
ncbi:uncharacterized protein DMAD_01726 [Drosophila madeirensis]|uniref:Kinetochore protein SPC25 n=1 Tax=Drosophila madeirensis TaxID=30013 RepID=A0AAU9G3A2_DROMD